ncbi:MAG: hypothetical protein HC827_20130 [Cyanobacteria bacterium RM1_2_2]|nr:hypothetical protein [Cyanobacteria bacterium RM1_2_2]
MSTAEQWVERSRNPNFKSVVGRGGFSGQIDGRMPIDLLNPPVQLTD